MELLFYIGAFLLGCLNVINRTVGFQATRHIGNNSGTLMNYITAFMGACVVMMVYPQARAGLVNMSDASMFLYLGGVFGVIAFFLNITSLHKMNLFQSGVMILIGQLIASFLLDFAFGFTFSISKLIGIAILIIGVMYDKKISLGSR